MKCETIWISRPTTLLWIISCCACIMQMGCKGDSSYQRRLTDVVQDDTIYVTFHSPAGWELVVYPEGAGRISFGSSRAESLTFPKETFQYKKLIDRTLEGIGPNEKLHPKSVGVTFGQPGIDYFSVKYLGDDDLALAVFEKAFEAALLTDAPTYHKRRMKKKYRNEPPVK